MPAPDFGVAEQAPPEPSPWTDTSTVSAGYQYYLVCPTCSNASDTSNTYGTPARPRATMPATVTGPAVVELDGEIDTRIDFVGSGSAAAPIFVRARSSASPPLVTVNSAPSGSYIIFEDLIFGPQDASDTDFGLRFSEGSDHLAVRGCEFTGNLQRSGGFSMGSYNYTGNGTLHDVVFDGNTVHDLGDLTSTQSVHCLEVSGSTDHVWVTHSALQRCNGHAIQIDAQAGRRPFVHHVYYGLNLVEGDRESGGWVDHATDVIFSQNLVHGIHGSAATGNGSCLGMQGGPEFVWFLDNEGYDCDVGINLGANDNDGADGQYTFVVGNVIHDTASANPGNVYESGGISVRGGNDVYVVNNTLVRCDGSLVQAPGAANLFAYSNILAFRANPGLTYDLVARNIGLDLENNLFDPSATQYQVNSVTETDFASMRAQAAQMGIEANNQLADPVFVDPQTDFRLQPGSPGVDQGYVSDVYTTFFNRYGQDIALDPNLVPRPQGSGWDIGAYER